MNLEIGPGENPIVGMDYYLDVRPPPAHLGRLSGRWIKDDLSNITYHFQPESLTIICMRSVLEHLSRHQVGTTLKTLWTLLKPGGKLELWTPDLRRIAQALVNGEIGILRAEWLIYGAYQDPPDLADLHKVGWDEDQLVQTLEHVGFSQVERLEPFHTDLHIIATK